MRKWIILACALVSALSAVACADILLARRRSIYDGVEFSGAYLDRGNSMLKIYLTHDEKYRVYKPITEYPPEFIEALLLQEDRRFYAHHGINPGSVIRAGWETYVRRSRRIGASTITMQVAKLKYGLYTRNIAGKLRQIFLALRLEAAYSKQQILEAYINLAPCGRNIEGFEAASRYFFGCGIERTNLSQMLMLCVLPQNPTRRCPSSGNVPRELMDARMRLFEQWCRDNPSDLALRDFMSAEPDLVCRFPDEAPHFTRLLEFNRGKNSRGMVRTTLDLSLQETVRLCTDSYLRQKKTLGMNNAAVLLLDWRSMEVLSYLGSGGFYDDAIQGQVDGNISKRSPGSALKPFIYALALEQGIIHYSTMLKDAPSSFSEYSPDNYGNTFMGPVKSWEALVQSRNVPAVALAQELSNPNLYGFLRDAGISRLLDEDFYGLSLVLGSADVTPMELCELYAMLLNGGLKYGAFLTLPHADISRTDGVRLLSEESCFIVRRMLEQNPPPEGGSGSAHEFLAGYKTGTSIGFRDSWAVGFFGQYVLCVWIGNFDGTGNNSFIGRAASAPLFFSIKAALESQGKCSLIAQDKNLTRPDAVSLVEVCSVSGALPGEDCPQTEEAWFIPGVSPIASCRIHRRINVDTRTGYRTDETPDMRERPWIQSVVREFWPSDFMELFAQAGLPRLSPPDYPPEEQRLAGASPGFAPEIRSPLRNTEYVFRRSTPALNVISLQASADASASGLFWFCESDFIARTSPGESFLWRPEPGSYTLTVTDSKGRSSSRTVSIRMVD